MKDLFSDIFDIVFDLLMFLFIGYGLLCLFSYVAYAAEPTPQVRTVTATILAEARGEGEAGMYAVACVIEKRARNRKLKPSAVCMQPKQFSCWIKTIGKKGFELQRAKRNVWYAVRTTRKETDYATLLARAVCANWNNEKTTALELDFIKHADHYHAKSVTPYWTKGKKPVAIIKNHVFYKLR